AAHSGKEFIKLIGKCHICKLIHYEMDMNREPSAVYNIRLVIELLEHLRIQHTNDKVKGTVVVRDNRKDCHLAFPKLIKFQFIVLRNTRKRFQIELFKAGNQGDLD